MTYEEAKRWLYEVRYMHKMKRYHLNEIDNIKDDCERIREGRAAVLCLAKVQKSGISKPTEEAAIKIIDEYGAKLKYHIKEIDKIDVQVAKMHHIIDKMRDDERLNLREFEILHFFFFEGMSNEEVAIATGYSIESVYKVKAKAIDKVATAIDCEASLLIEVS